jgi:hypothetical protein
MIDEARRDELAQYPKLSKVEAERWRGGQGQYINYVGKIEFFT